MLRAIAEDTGATSTGAGASTAPSCCSSALLSSSAGASTRSTMLMAAHQREDCGIVVGGDSLGTAVGDERAAGGAKRHNLIAYPHSVQLPSPAAAYAAKPPT